MSVTPLERAHGEREEVRRARRSATRQEEVAEAVDLRLGERESRGVGTHDVELPRDGGHGASPSQRSRKRLGD